MDTVTTRKARFGRGLLWAAVLSAILSLLLVTMQTNSAPRTDDATVRANYIQIAPEVAGRLAELPVRDNQVVRQGDLLFQIDPRSYRYALGVAESDQNQLEQQLVDQVRHISSERSAVDAAAADLRRFEEGVRTADSGVEVANSSVRFAEATVARELASLNLAKATFDRISPLLAKQFVTAQQVDDAGTSVRLTEERYNEALARLETARKQLRQSGNRREESDAEALASAAKLREAFHNIDTTETLRSQRLAKLSRIESARVDLERCRVRAPFDALVTNLNISKGAYAHVGAPMFTLIDMRTWYVIANYRESKLKHIHPGDRVDIFLMARPDHRFHGVVESIGNGVAPEDGRTVEGLPDVSRTLNWVHLAARFPVRIRVQDPEPALFRVGATAVTVVRE